MIDGSSVAVRRSLTCAGTVATVNAVRSRQDGVRVVDVALASALLVLVEAAVVASRQTRPGPTWLAAVWGALAVIPLAWRREAPIRVWGISSLSALVAFANHGSPGVLALAPLIALYTVATTCPRRVSLTAGAATVIGGTLAVVASRPSGVRWREAGSVAPKLLFPIVLVAAAWLIGDNLRVRRAYVAELEAKAARAQADRTADLARAASAERTRIARELHDVVVHHVSVIAVQAGAARLLADQAGDTSESRQSWLAVETTARTALAELREILGLLRSDREPSALTPPPGIDQLDRLIEDVRQAGLSVDARVEGTPVVLPPAVDLSGYRIVQEALTNVLKHAGAVPTTVVVRYGDDRLDVEVSNGGPVVPSSTQTMGGHGLEGMRERVALLGGSFDAHPQVSGGFAVVASIPARAQVPGEGSVRRGGS
jgi:signal transduction histidine kinase